MKILLSVLFLIGVVFLAFGKTPAVENFETDARMKKHLNTIHKKASSLEHFDEDFEDFDGENYEDFEDEAYETEFLEHAEKLKKRGVVPTKARQGAYAKMTAKYGTRFKKAMSRASKKGSSSLIGKNPFYDASAMFDIIIKRKSVNIAQALPVPLFAAIHYNAKYKSVIGQYLPSNISITTIAVDSNGNVIVTYTNSVDDAVDTVEISCVQVPYITFLGASQFNAMRIGKFRYQLSDATQLTQFNQIFDVVEKTLFGKGSQNQVSVGAFKDPRQYQAGIIDVDNAIDINLETGIVVGLIAVDEFSTTLSCFVERFNRTNTKA